MRPILHLLLPALLFLSCQKPGSENSTPTISYGARPLYAQGHDDPIRPSRAAAGTWSSFPEGLRLDSASGAIDAARSEKGTRYRIMLRSAGNETLQTYLTIAGINFRDRYYQLKSNDSIAFPIYNADPAVALPSGTFDEDGQAAREGCVVKGANGQINLKESIRSGLFGRTPQNSMRKEVELTYRLNDESRGAPSKIKLVLYYFNTMSDVPKDLRQTIEDHLAMTLLPDNRPLSALAVSSAAAKPRPPCIVIIAH